MLIGHLASGLSYKSFAGMIEINATTLFDWEKKHVEFKEAKEIGMEQNLLFWEKLGIQGLTDKKFNTVMWIFNMRNRHGWTNEPQMEDRVRSLEVLVNGLDANQLIGRKKNA